MKHFFLIVFAGFCILSTSSCGKKSDTPGASDSTKKADSAKSTSSAAVSPASARYPIKSGIIHGENETMGMKMTTAKSFDDYGAKVREETSSSMAVAGTVVKTHEVKIMKDGW